MGESHGKNANDREKEQNDELEKIKEKKQTENQVGRKKGRWEPSMTGQNLRQREHGVKRRNHADIKRPTALRALSAVEANEKWWPYSPDLPTGAIFHFVTIRKPRWLWSLSRSSDL